MTPPASLPVDECWACENLFMDEGNKDFRMSIYRAMGPLTAESLEAARVTVREKFAAEHAGHSRSWLGDPDG